MTHPDIKEIKDSKPAQDLAADLSALRDDFAKLSGAVRELLQARATSTTRRVVGVVDDARQKLSDEMGDAKDHLESHLGTLTADVETTIERNPLLAVLVGAAIGFVIGLVSRPHK
jgi:ElaB/YqjD/DUF883 family membrane-anchored ribosome-binding protein